MKNILAYLLLVGSVALVQAQTNEPDWIKKLRGHIVDPRASRGDISKEIATNQWGEAVGGLRLSLSLQGPGGQGTTNKPVVVVLRIWNVSTNEDFWTLVSNNEQNWAGFGFHVVSPSGKETDLVEGPGHGSGSILGVGTNEIGHLAFNLSLRFAFNEVGAYGVIASRTWPAVSGGQPLNVLSNPLVFSITSAAKGP